MKDLIKAEMSVNRKLKFPKDVQISAKSRHEKNVTHSTILVWKIADFSKLRQGVMYAQLYESENVKCVFRLFKQFEVLHLSLTSADLFKDTAAEFSILDEVDCKSLRVKAEQIKDGVFVGKFIYERWLFRMCTYRGTLTVAFKYASDYFTAYREVDADQVYLAHLDDLCYDLKTMYLEAMFPDIKIYVRDYTFKAHKFVLDARSIYFHNLFVDDRKMVEVTLHEDILPGILHQVLLYFYSGELMEMNEECMVHVYKTASSLEARALLKRCVKYFEKKVNQGDSTKVFELIKEHELKDLKIDLERAGIVVRF